MEKYPLLMLLQHQTSQLRTQIGEGSGRRKYPHKKGCFSLFGIKKIGTEECSNPQKVEKANDSLKLWEGKCVNVLSMNVLYASV